MQAHLRVVPVKESSSWVPVSSSNSMCNLPRRKTSLQLKPTSPIKEVPRVRHFSDSTPSSRSVSPPNMAYLGLSPCSELPHSPMSKKSLELLMEAGEFENSGKIFRVGSCKSFEHTGDARRNIGDSFDEFVSDFVLVDDESDCDFHWFNDHWSAESRSIFVCFHRDVFKEHLVSWVSV